MNFLHQIQRKGVEIARGVETMIDRADMDIIDVEQQAAARKRAKFGEKLRFGEAVADETQIGGWVFHENPAPQRRLRPIDLFRDAAKRRLVVGEGQEVG